ncbi:MAG: alpha-glucoside ABC transporter permease [Anaerolineaceae bacterium]|nr:alpha-glucoside ABC transporter permease [Anaerolineaceae bacterium]
MSTQATTVTSTGSSTRAALSTRVPVFNMSVGALISRAILLFIVIIWTVPTFGLLISSFRNPDALSTSGWWTALSTSQDNIQGRTATAADQVETDDGYVISGAVLDDNSSEQVVSFGGGFLPGEITDYQPGTPVELEDGTSFTLNADGTYAYTSAEPFELERGNRFFFVVSRPPTFSLDNYTEVLQAAGFGQSFINTVTVAVPSTIIPIAIAAFAAYAFSWMEFPGRRIMFYIVVGLIVVPLQMALIPLIRIYNSVGIAQTYPGIWLAHTGFGLPLAIFLLRNYIGGLPRELIESAKIDGASHFQTFIRLVLPLSVPALAAFAIFQFLWVWNDLLVALVFLGKLPDQIVMTARIRELIGSRGEDWEILTSSAFISIAVPLLVFFSLQRYFVRGLLAGSVKGG